jgi:hypothetical protein
VNHPYEQGSSDVLVTMVWSFIMGMTMEVIPIPMLVPVDMVSTRHQLPYKGYPQYNEDYPDNEFHGQGHLIGNSKFENQHPKADSEKGKGVTYAPA